VLRTVRAVAKGGALFGPAIARRLTTLFRHAEGKGVSVSPFPELTDREREILELIAEGLDNAAIADRLYISGKTVSNHISNIFTKLHLSDRAQAIVAAREAGLGRRLSPPEA
ncbi:MAG: response regulator transcription factor, partial [Halobacteriales archaeon]|nr:response regulator transcription factor [Halobacteriales archaeon]